ncbi:hypothetical protein NLJ89_g11653 [Agrocybe chaxingu]|uniref:Amine oxidase n=1 Tax=Agrocybe chaxingu TaxID=84603 RepID=A0A9W8MMU5_9AGAR|nr:hypothetical protein NLJ89_g11653 [Agrocybe chaxingu]
MKLANAFSLLTDLRIAVQVAIVPTLTSILRNPTLLFRPYELSRVFMANVWAVFGDGVDTGGKEVKEGLITPNAYGVVLDIGAGHGHTVRYLDRARVGHYVALEPNELMHQHIRAQANAAGYHESDGMWPAGKYVPQTREEPEDSVGSWVKGQMPVEDEDILVYVTVGTTHIPRPEDWPVMPVEHLTVSFKPNSFFKANPSMDVPGTKDPLSVNAFGPNAEGQACCK